MSPARPNHLAKPSSAKSLGRAAHTAAGAVHADSVYTRLQQLVGNRAVVDLLAPPGAGKKQSGEESRAEIFKQAASEPGQALNESIRPVMEQRLGRDLGRVRVHSGPQSNAAADSVGARAYTIGADIYLGSAARQLSKAATNHLLAHEIVHTVQQGGLSVPLHGRMRIGDASDRTEREASQLAEGVATPTHASRNSASPSPGSLQPSAVPPHVQRDIVGKQKLANGDFEINFTKTDGAVLGDNANESGKITFTPNAKAPESDSIHFVQIARTTDKSSGTESDFVWTGSEAPRNSMITAGNKANTVTPGFYVDQNAGSLAKRTKKADPDVLPYYDLTGPADPANKIGKRKGGTIEPAVLSDAPGGPPPGRFLFVTSAKASDTGVWYGTVLWGFELYLDKAGVQKIKGEYHQFREGEGATTDAAIRKFDEYYRNPGASTAPAK